MRFKLLCLAALLFAGCAPTEVASVPTLRGPIVPTRVLPTATHTPTQTETPSPTLTFTATETPSPTLTFTPTDIVPTATQTDTPSPTPLPTETPSATVTNTQETPSPTATNTQETPSPTATDTQAAPSPTATDTPAPSLPAPTSTPEFTPAIYSASTWIEPVETAGTAALGMPIYSTIDNQHPALLYTYSGTAGEVIDIELFAQEDTLDPFLMLLDPKGREIVRNDDVTADDSDSVVRGVALPETGTYLVVATRYAQQFGDTVGNFELVVSPGSATPTGMFSALIGYDTLVEDTISPDDEAKIYTFRAAAGDVISIQMTALTGNLDSNVTLTDNLGNILAYNDDNLLLGTVDSSISGYIIPRTGFYSVVADHYRGEANSGNFRLKLARDGQNAISRFAVLDWVNSVTLGEENDTYFRTYILGDWFNSASEERGLQVLLTFYLPPASERSVEEAVFTFAPCREYGGGLSALGEITIYDENFGNITQMRNMQRPQPGARILSTQSTCAPLNLTDRVQEAYANGEEEVQFRLLVRDLVDNGVADQVMITPSLLVTFEE